VFRFQQQPFRFPSLCRVICILVLFPSDPLISIMPVVSAGGTVTLTCRVRESDNSSLQWSNTAQQTLYFGEKRALRDNRIQLHRSTPTELSITIADVQLSDEGEYTCSIFTMPVRTARATVTVLGVPGKPQISGFETAVQEGNKVTLTCTSTGSKPPAKLHWYRGEEKLEGERCRCPECVCGSGDVWIVRSYNSVCAVIAQKEEERLCNHALCVLMCLSLTDSPNVQIQPESDLPREGEKFSLRCLGTGNPDPITYIWEKKDGELPSLAKSDGAVLHFPMLNKSDNGVYICHADNDPTTPTLDSTASPSFAPSPTPPSPSPDVVTGSDPTAMTTSSGVDHAVIGGVVAVIVFILLCLLIVLGRYLIRHKGTYLTHEAKGSDDAPDADTAIINAEGGHSGAEDKKEYFI
uniref:Cell adhesion molecule 3 n=1 Tax=Salarias fasciatus TaxID=181472 RepID=A0A672JT89_SALFA